MKQQEIREAIFLENLKRRGVRLQRRRNNPADKKRSEAYLKRLWDEAGQVAEAAVKTMGGGE